MADALLVSGWIGDTRYTATCDALEITGDPPIVGWLTALLGATVYSLEAMQALIPDYPRLFGPSLEVIDYTDLGTAPRPQLTSLTPRTMVAEGDDVTLHVYGTGFVPRSVILFNGGAETTVFVSSQELTTVVVGVTATTPGEYPVAVETGGLGGGVSGAALFAILPAE